VAATRVAVVDDDRAVRELLENLLADEGYAVTTLRPTPDLVANVRSARPQVIILDWRLEGTEGSAFGAVRADATLSRIPVLICTGDLDGMRAEAPRLATQPDVVIVEKPFQIDVLLDVLARLATTTASAAPAPSAPAELRHDLQEAIDRRGVVKQARAVLRLFRRAGGWAAAELWLADRGLLRCVAGVADERRTGFVDHSRQTSLVPGFGLPGRVWSSARPAWVANVEEDRNFPRVAAARRFGVRSAAGVPVRLGGSVIGMVGVYGPEPREHDQAQVDELAGMAAGLGTWLDAARGDLLRPDPVSAAARRLAQEAAQLAEVAAVDLLNEDGTLQRVAVAHRDPAMTEVAMRLEAFSPAPEGPVARAVDTREVQQLTVSDATLRRWSGSPEHLLVMRALQLHSLVAMPLVHQDRVIGGVTLSSADPDWHSSSSARDAVAALTGPGASRELGRLLLARRARRDG
jgi:FixJ family two-component response regulator